jgi:hypothetical protein
MRRFSFRFTIRSLMLTVLLAAIISAIGVLMPRGVDPWLGERGLSMGAVGYFSLITTMTVVVSLPFVAAVLLGIGPKGKTRSRCGLIMRRLLAVGSLALGLMLAHYPMDGLRSANQLKDGNFLCYYYQYRLWPGDHVTPCLETMTATGKSRSYPIARNTFFLGRPDIRTNADQSVVWLIDEPGARNSYGVWCSLNRVTGEFVGHGGKHPECVSETPGFPLAH